MYVSLYIYIYIYTHMLWRYCLVQVWPFEGLLSGPSFFVLTLFVKNAINRGVSTFFLKERVARQQSGVIIWVQVGHFKSTKLRPDNKPYLDQIITPQNVLLLKNVLKHLYLQCLLNMNQTLAKTPTFTLQNTCYKKKRLLQHPPIDQQLVFFELVFFLGET